MYKTEVKIPNKKSDMKCQSHFLAKPNNRCENEWSENRWFLQQAGPIKSYSPELMVSEALGCFPIFRVLQIEMQWTDKPGEQLSFPKTAIEIMIGGLENCQILELNSDLSALTAKIWLAFKDLFVMALK